MKTRETLTAEIASWNTGVKAEDIVVAFEYDLPLTASRERLDGVIAVTASAMTVFRDKKAVETRPLAGCSDFKCTPGVGCVFIEYKFKGEDALLCRADNSYKRLYAAVTKRLDRMIEKHGYSYDYESDVNSICPKCGRPLPPGQSTCPHCEPKTKYIKRLWDIAKPYHGYIYASVVFYFMITAMNMIVPYIQRVAVDSYITPKNADAKGFLLVIASMVGVTLITRVISVGRSQTLIIAGNKLIVRLREMVFDKIQMMSISRISKRTSGELMNRVTGDTHTLQDFITNDLGEGLEEILIFLAVSIYLFVYDWHLAAMILLPMPFVALAYRAIWRLMHHMYHRQWNCEAKSSSILHDIFSGIRVVKAFGMEKRETARYDDANRELRDVSLRNERFFAKIMPVLDFFMGIGQFFLMYYVGSKILKNEMTLGEMAQFSSYVSIIYGPLRWVAGYPRRVMRVMTSMVKIFDVVDEKADVADRPDAKDMTIRGEVEVDHVSFGYDDSTDVLRDITFTAKPGEMIGIVGKSGVGKSTLINLIMRLYDVGEGTIKIDGTDIRDISQESLRSQIGVVLQETFLFSGTIYDNIGYAKPGATRDEIINAAKIAGAHQFIMRLPEAYNTRVGEHGYTMSGGERQRIAIARALLHNPRILILDEATASLDTETEKQIQDSLQKLIRDRTTFAIAHRLSTLRNATRLIVLDKNTIVETGTHEELMKKKGIYYGLVMAQRQMSKMKNTAAPAVSAPAASA